VGINNERRRLDDISLFLVPTAQHLCRRWSVYSIKDGKR
jgi:hypothetical protein